MKFLITILFVGFAFSISAQDVVGTWKTIDDGDGIEKSHVELYEVDGKLHGKIIEILEGAEGDTCVPCKGDRKDKPLVGMEIIWGMKNKKGTYDGGKIFDPASGKEYKCKISIGENKDELDVRGYIGFSLIGRTQTWYRVK